MIRIRGVALITALLLTTLAGSVAAGLAWDNALDVRRTMVMVPCWMMALRSLRVTMPMRKKPRYSAWHIALNRFSSPSR